MTDQAPAVTPETVPEVKIDFPYREDGRDQIREIWARMPSPEQLLVWKRTLDHLQKLPDATSWTADTVMAMLERTRKIIDSLLVHRADVTWLDDQFLDGTLTFRDIMPIVGMIVDAFAEAGGNREERRAAAKTTKKAARKKADATP